MIFYNWKRVLNHSKKSAKEVVSIIDYITFKPIPIHERDKNYLYSLVNWSGDSFLLNPKALIRASYRDVSASEVAYYIGLASLRNYPEFATVGTLSLDLLACIGKEDIISKNSLLRIKDGRVLFKYEEATRRNKVWH